MSPARTLAAASVLLSALIIALVSTALATTSRFLTTSLQVDEAQQSLTESASLRSSLRHAEDSYRGYLLTGQGEYLQSLKSDMAIWPEYYGRLLALARNDPQRQALVQELRPLITARMAALSHGAALMAIDAGRARAFVEAGGGAELMQRVESALNRLREVESASLQGYSRRAGHLDQLSQASNWLGGSLAVATVLSGTALLLRQWRRLADAEAAVRAANAGLGAQVAERTQELQLINHRLMEQARELAQVNHELDAFSASVSHDLQSPLRRIEVMSGVLVRHLGDQLSASDRGVLDMLVHNVQNMRELIRELLDFARLTRMPPKQGTVQMQDLAAECWQALAMERKDRHIELVQGRLPPCLGDVHLLGQVLVNLLSNAIKYTKRKQDARIELSGDIDGPLIRYAVRDNGVGFDMRSCDRLFDLFSRLHASGEFEGSGVGLATARRIVERHGGRIWAEAQPDLGASFFFTIPRCT